VPSVIQIDDVQPLSEDLDELRSLLGRLVGKPFLFLRASYGDELTLHLGEAMTYPNPRMKGCKKGSYIVALRASTWVLESGLQPGLVYTSGEIFTNGSSSRASALEWEEIEARGTIRPRALVIDVIAEATPSGLMLALSFSDGSSLTVLPIQSADSEGDDAAPLSDWEVFMPRHRVLKAGPGPSWSYTDSKAKPKDESAA
jgi:hypothetical protein